jgi:hypothetical protein
VIDPFLMSYGTVYPALVCLPCGDSRTGLLAAMVNLAALKAVSE